MPANVSLGRRITTTLSWPFGMAWTTSQYIWRILPVYRVEEEGSLPDDLPPPLPADVSHAEVQRPADGVGPLLHRIYSGQIADAPMDSRELIARIAADPNQVTPRQIARFDKAVGETGSMQVGDEFLVHMPGPWNGPVRVVEIRPDGFRFATLAGHLEAGQIEWRAWEDDVLHFAVESWSRQGDRFSALLHDRLRMAKEASSTCGRPSSNGCPDSLGGVCSTASTSIRGACRPRRSRSHRTALCPRGHDWKPACLASPSCVSATVGLIGVGRMGAAICGRLVRSGFEVLATDIRPELEDRVREAGAAWSPDTRLVAATADVTITVMPGPGELEAAMEVARQALRPGTAWIDMTTAGPKIGRELASSVHEVGVECLDAPAGGNPAAAAAGELQLFVGGRAESVERHRPLLETLGTVQHVGDTGAGHTTKLLVNLLWFGQAVAVGEALLLARRTGIDLELLRGVLTESAAASKFVSHDLSALLEGDYLESFGLDRCCEELDTVVGLAHDLSVPFELSTAVRSAYRRALDRYGPVDGELLAVALLEEQAGTPLRVSARPAA